MSVMAAVRRVAAMVGDTDQVMDWWCRDLPLPHPSTHYSWATDTVFLVSNFQKFQKIYIVDGLDISKF